MSARCTTARTVRWLVWWQPSRPAVLPAVNATFNENGDPLNVEVYNEAGQLYSTDVYTYNEKG